MAGLPSDEINKIRKSSNIVDIIGTYVNLEPKGKNYFGVCPFHDDHSPSMSVSPEKQIYTCFVCGASGNVFTFLQEYKNISFLEAVKEVANSSGLSVNVDVSRPKMYEKEKSIMDVANKFYINNLKSQKGQEALKYLKSRGIDENIIKEFEIGVALKDGDTLSKLLIGKKYDEKTLIDVGISNKNDRIYDVFRNRITFPVHNPNGEVVAFSARIYNGEADSKYINSRESVIFKKGEVLFNYHRAVNEVRKSKYILLVEGQMDAIRIYSSGIKSVVATMGTALTKEQITLLRRCNVPVKLLMDSDSAGEKATISNGELLQNANINVEVIRLSGAKDPDEYILKYGIDKFKDVINSSISLFHYKLKYYKNDKNLSNADDITNYINKVIEELNKRQDEILTDVTLNKLSEEFNISKDILKQKIVSKEIIKPTISKKIVNKNKKKYDKVCEAILYYMLNDAYYIKAFSDLNYIPDAFYMGLAKDICAYYILYKNIEIADFLTYIKEDEEKYKMVVEVINEHDEELNSSDWNNYIKFIKKWINDNKIEELKLRLKNTLDINEKLELNDRIAKLKKEVD